MTITSSDLAVAPRHVGRLLARFACAAALAVLAACGGDDDGVAAPTPTPPPPTSPQPPPAANAAPVAAFTSASTAVAGTPLMFDAGGSSDADGDALTYSWGFGNGVRGGGRNIAHIFDAAGSYTVRLTVDDGRGGSAFVERSVVVSPGPAASGSVSLLAVVRDARGTPLADVAVSVINGGATAATAANGRATLTTALGAPVVLKFSRAGYADQFKRFTLPTAAESGYLEVTMIAREAAQTLPDAATGGTLAGKDGARITLAPGSLVDASGNPVSGPVQVSMTPVDVAAEARAFPGRFEGVGPDGSEGLILSYGTVEYILTQNNAPVQLAPGKKATIEIPVYTALNRDGSPVNVGDSYPLWSLNERTGTWVLEGAGTVVAAGSPSDLALRGEVTHFSWWNHDVFDAVPYKPKPRCLVDTNYDGVPEDLTGTGYCAHEASPFWENQASSSSGMARPMAEPRTRRIPAWVASAATPVAGGVELPVPSDLDIVFHSTALNGTLYGRRIVRGAADISEAVDIVLSPVQDATGTVAISAPWNQVYAMSHVGEGDRFALTAQAGQNLSVSLSRSNGSVLSGAMTIRNPAGTVVDSASLGAGAASVTITNATAGTYTIDISATASAPGAYRLQVQTFAASCSNAAALSLPTDANYPIAASAVRCFALDLSADAVIDVELPSRVGLSGSLQLRAPSDEIIARDSFQPGSRTPVLRLGVAQAGRYQLEVVNTSGASGTVRLTGSYSSGEAITLPQELTVTAVGSGESRRFLLKRPSAGADFGLGLSACNGTYAGVVYPTRTALQVAYTAGCATGRGVRALAHRVHPLVLPVIDVTRNSTTATGDAEFTLQMLVPIPLALDTDVRLDVPALNRAVVYTFDGAAGQEVSLGVDRPGTSDSPVVARINAPDGTALNAASAVTALPSSGLYSVEVANTSSYTGSLRVRVNNAAAPAPWTLTPPLAERTETLALGQVRRYTVDLNQAEVLTLGLASPGTLDIEAALGTTALGAAAVSLSGSSAPQSRISQPSFARETGPRLVTVRSLSRAEARSTGTFTIGIQKPVPTPTVLGAEVAASLTPLQMVSYAYTVPGNGYYLLRGRYPETVTGLGARVWGPSTTFANYTGDLAFGAVAVVGGFYEGETVGTLRTGSNTLTVINESAATTLPFTMSLVRLEAPTDLAPGAAATNGSIGGAGERDYYRFSATASQAYTVTINAAFNGSVYVRRLMANNNYTDRFTTTIATFPRALAAGVPMVASFTIPSDQAGTYVIEVDATGAETGSYTVQLTTP
jgi:PKD repeat protein